MMEIEFTKYEPQSLMPKHMVLFNDRQSLNLEVKGSDVEVSILRQSTYMINKHDAELIKKFLDDFTGERFRHYKGGIYTVIGTAMHSETLEPMVIYRSHDGSVWVRPAAMFFAILPDGKTPRFSKVVSS